MSIKIAKTVGRICKIYERYFTLANQLQSRYTWKRFDYSECSIRGCVMGIEQAGKQAGKCSITSSVLDALRKEICSSAYADGQFITETEVSQKYQVSKTPAREALAVLCQEKLLSKIPRKGYMVKKLSAIVRACPSRTDAS